MKTYIFGRNTFSELLKTDKKILRVFLTLKTFKIFEEKIKNLKIPFLIKEPNFFHSYIDGNHQGVIAIFLENFQDIEKKFYSNVGKGNFLLLDSVKDPNNLGSIFRTALALGIKGIILSKHNQTKITPTVHKCSSGASLKMPFIFVNSLFNIIQEFKKKDYWIMSTSSHFESQNINDVKLNDHKLLFCIGSEGEGLSQNIIKHSDFKVRIPLTKEVESLNISVATGIILYHFSNNDEHEQKK